MVRPFADKTESDSCLLLGLHGFRSGCARMRGSSSSPRNGVAFQVGARRPRAVADRQRGDPPPPALRSPLASRSKGLVRPAGVQRAFLNAVFPAVTTQP